MTNVSCDVLSIFNKKNEIILHKDVTKLCANYIIKNATITYQNNTITIIGKEIKYFMVHHTIKDYNKRFYKFDESEQVKVTSKFQKWLLYNGSNKIIFRGLRKVKGEQSIQLSFTKLNRDIIHKGF